MFRQKNSELPDDHMGVMETMTRPQVTPWVSSTRQKLSHMTGWGVWGGGVEEPWRRSEFHGCYFSLCVSYSEGRMFSQCGRFLLATVASHSNAHGRLCVCCVAVKGSRKCSHSVLQLKYGEYFWRVYSVKKKLEYLKVLIQLFYSFG